MTWVARIKSSAQSARTPFKAEVFNGAGVLQARISGSAEYVCEIVAAMCERRSKDVSDLLTKPKPLLYCIHGGG